MPGIRTRSKAVGAAAVALLTAVLAGTALASTVGYGGDVTGHQRDVVAFYLIGARCPSGPHCFDHAKVTEFGAANFDYPDCPELSEGAFEFGDPNTGRYVAVKVDKHLSFGGHGQDRGDPHLKVSFHGRFVRHGARAAGWLEVHNYNCSTGRLNWTAVAGG